MQIQSFSCMIIQFSIFFSPKVDRRTSIKGLYQCDNFKKSIFFPFFNSLYFQEYPVKISRPYLQPSTEQPLAGIIGR